MPITVDGLFDLMKGPLDARRADFKKDPLYFDPREQEGMKKLFGKFLEQYQDQFDNCALHEDLDNKDVSVLCSAKDGTGNYLGFSHNKLTEGYTLYIGNNKDDKLGLNHAELNDIAVSCSRFFRSLPKNMPNAYDCMGFTDNSSYYMRNRGDAGLTEGYIPSSSALGTCFLSDSKDFPAFDYYLKQSTLKEVRKDPNLKEVPQSLPLDAILTTGKYAVGIVATMHFGGEACLAMKELLSATVATDNAKLQGKVTTVSKDQTKQRALLNGTAAIACLLFTAIMAYRDYGTYIPMGEPCGGSFRRPIN